ncbi:translation initiation factor IF-6 [Candidatus Micrarchaeota archaeon]|nr:translation initiation factor IF-6 [Candidatus Micrarchaeota archaeon]
MKYRRAAYFGNPFIGLFICTNGKHTLFPLDAKQSLVDAVCESLGTKEVRVNIGGNNLNGIYAAMNGNGIVLPSNTPSGQAKKIGDETGLSVYVSKEKFNAHGNNVALNDMGGLINPNVGEKERVAMEECLGIELVPFSLEGFSAMGSMCVANNKGFLIHYCAGERAIAEIGEILRVKGMPGTINMGTGFVSIGLLANDKGYFAGEATSPFELGRVEEALEFI